VTLIYSHSSSTLLLYAKTHRITRSPLAGWLRNFTLSPFLVASLPAHPTRRLGSYHGPSPDWAYGTLADQQSERRVEIFVSTAVRQASLHLCIFAYLHICIFASSHLHIFTSLHICIFAYLHLHIFTSSHPPHISTRNCLLNGVLTGFSLHSLKIHFASA
jgi:hypothetical protein